MDKQVECLLSIPKFFSHKLPSFLLQKLLQIINFIDMIRKNKYNSKNVLKIAKK